MTRTTDMNERARRARAWLSLTALVVALQACSGHTSEKTEVRSGDCTSCHLDEALATTDPPHASAGFDGACADCHDETRWIPAREFVHTTSFPLTQAHAGPTCSDCHTSGFSEDDISKECVACHADRAAAVDNPVHAGLSQDCFACHRTDAFEPAHFIHAWPLKGTHAMVRCNGCHTGNPARYEGTSSACVSCHADDRARADLSVDGHESYSSTCETCHDFDGF